MRRTLCRGQLRSATSWPGTLQTLNAKWAPKVTRVRLSWTRTGIRMLASHDTTRQARWQSAILALGEMRRQGQLPDVDALRRVADECASGWTAVDERCKPADVLKVVRFFAFARQAHDHLVAAAWGELRRWALAVDGNISPRPPQTIINSTPRHGYQRFSSTPSLISGCTHWDVFWKPSGWAMSWTVSVATEFDAIPARPENVPIKLHQPFTCYSGYEKDFLEWLSSRNESSQLPIRQDALLAYGILHRLDAGTSGPICCARSYVGWAWLSLQFASLAIVKHYVCLCYGWVPPPIDSQRIVKGRLRLSDGRRVSTGERHVGSQAVTEIRRVVHLKDCAGVRYSLVQVKPRTGRKHQIRAQMSALGFPIVGDAKYGAQVPQWCPRIFLHCHRLVLPALSADLRPNERMQMATTSTHDIRCRLPFDLRNVLTRLSLVSCEERDTSEAEHGEGSANDRDSVWFERLSSR